MASIIPLIVAGLVAGPPSSFQQHDWPFAPLARPAVPQVQNDGWAENPVDTFVLHALQQAKLAPSMPADRLTLLRRLSYDLIGLPPTVDEQRAFLADGSPGAYERLVDRLLASPHYGERWAQHWLDVVRYADTTGFKADRVRPDLHKYRDYVIRSLNEDLPYDSFIRQQIAGDELESDNPDALIATGLNRLYPEDTQTSDFPQARQDILDDVTEVAGLAFLGLTMNCAKCHDHKFDPIKQSDYFRLQAFFAPMLPRDDTVAVRRAEQLEYGRRLAEWEAATQSIRAEMDALVAGVREKAIDEAVEAYDAVTQQAIDTPPQDRTCYQKQIVALAQHVLNYTIRRAPNRLEGAAKERYESLVKHLATYDHLKPPALPTALSVSDGDDEAPATFVLATGNRAKPLYEVKPGFPEFLDPVAPDIVRPTQRAESTGRRSALAEWLCRPDHPLTARVMANRIWQHHFGRGIVGTPNDFGAAGQRASHPELLDWLASEIVASGWRIKPLHRLIVMSSTYRQSSQFDAADPNHARAAQVDPDNKLLSRFRRQRLDGEQVRDTLLAVSGQLNRELFGPSFKPELPAEAKVSRYAWQVDADLARHDRRSAYMVAFRGFHYPLFSMFDRPDGLNSCAQRSVTTTAPQSLALLNGELTLNQARAWAGRLLNRHGDDADALVRDAFAAAFGRPASDAEVAAARRFLAEQSVRVETAGGETPPEALPTPVPVRVALPAATMTALVDLCHALMNSSELLFVE
jgi:hypothetical protein